MQSWRGSTSIPPLSTYHSTVCRDTCLRSCVTVCSPDRQRGYQLGARADHFWSVPSLLPQLRPSNRLVCSWGQVVDANTIRYVSQAETVEGSTTVGLHQLLDAVWPLMSSEDQNASRGGSPCLPVCPFLSLLVFASLSLSPSVCLSVLLSLFLISTPYHLHLLL